MDSQIRQLWRDSLADDSQIDLLGVVMLRAEMLIDPIKLYRDQQALPGSRESVDVVFYPMLPTTISCDMSRTDSKWRAWIDEYRSDSVLENWRKCRAPETMLHLIFKNEGLSHRLLLATHLLLPSVINQINPYKPKYPVPDYYSHEVSQVAPEERPRFIRAAYAYQAYDAFSALASDEFYCYLLNMMHGVRGVNLAAREDEDQESRSRSIERANIIRQVIPLPTKDRAYFRQRTYES